MKSEKLKETYCTQKKCPYKDCQVHKSKVETSQSGVEYAVAPMYRTKKCKMREMR